MPAPNYRFRGQVKPQPRQPLRAQVGVAEAEGVATIRLYDPIDSWGDEWGVSAKEFAAALDEIPDANEIRLHVNSPGGEVYEGIAILNQLRNHPARTVAVVDSLAASAASFIVCGADELIMAKNAELMIHDAWGLCMGNSADMRTLAAQLDKISDNIASVYAEKAGTDAASWRAAMLAETWYSAQEAVDAGLADGLAEPPKDAPKASFDRSMFRHQNRATAPTPIVPAASAKAAPTGSVQRLVRLAALKHGLPMSNSELLEALHRPFAAADDPADASMLSQALGWLTSIDNIVDEAQETLSSYLGVPNSDADDSAGD